MMMIIKCLRYLVTSSPIGPRHMAGGAAAGTRALVGLDTGAVARVFIRDDCHLDEPSGQGTSSDLQALALYPHQVCGRAPYAECV